jgi:hypothetical protein
MTAPVCRGFKSEFIFMVKIIDAFSLILRVVPEIFWELV